MPRYFFHITNGVAHEDDHGQQLVDLKAARLEAFHRFGQMIADEPQQFADGLHDWRMEVTDRDGLMLFRIDLDFLFAESPSTRGH
jgi:hypothetical protein